MCQQRVDVNMLDNPKGIELIQQNRQFKIYIEYISAIKITPKCCGVVKEFSVFKLACSSIMTVLNVNSSDIIKLNFIILLLKRFTAKRRDQKVNLLEELSLAIRKIYKLVKFQTLIRFLYKTTHQSMPVQPLLPGKTF